MLEAAGLVALTGTPGTGKTTLAPMIAAVWKMKVIELNRLAADAGALEPDPEGIKTLDLDILQQWLHEHPLPSSSVIEGHLAHEIPVDRAVVLRCTPSVLEVRLRSRGYSEEKVRQNVEAELMDLIVDEVRDRGLPFIQLDTSSRSAEASVEFLTTLTEWSGGDEVDWIAQA